MKENIAGIIKLTPSHLQIIKALWPGQRPSNLKRLIVGGEQFERQLAMDIYELFDGNIEIYNEYGPTEATVGCMIYRFEPDETENADRKGIAGEAVPVGIPAANTRIYILDRHQQPVPFGVPGELYIAGTGLARGYLNRPQLTADKFIKTPEGVFCYRTGDLARWLPHDPEHPGGRARNENGVIRFLGRIDDQVKIRGHRIELGEIENRLMNHEAVDSSVVVLRESTGGDYHICAYVVPVKTGGEDGNATDPASLAAMLREWLSETLPDYMIPTTFTSLERMPLTPGGKIDRKALPEPLRNRAGNYTGPVSGIEESLVKLWSEILEVPVDSLGSHDNFFPVGRAFAQGNSAGCPYSKGNRSRYFTD